MQRSEEGVLQALTAFSSADFWQEILSIKEVPGSWEDLQHSVRREQTQTVQQRRYCTLAQRYVDEF